MKEKKNIFFFRAANPPQASWCEIWDGTPPKIYILALHGAWAVYILNFNCVVLNVRAYGRDHLSINTVSIGFSEIFGVFIGIYLVLYTQRRWLWSGIIAIGSGVLAYFTWLIPETCKFITKHPDGNLSGIQYLFFFNPLFCFAVKETHVVALEMAPTLAIKASTSIGMCVLTACTVDLVLANRKKILMFSATIWARAWFLWAPFIFVLQAYDAVLPLTVFATLSVCGGLLLVLIHNNQYKNYLQDCEKRMQAMRTMRSISNAGLDWIKHSRRKSVYDISEEQNKQQPISTIYDVDPNGQRV